MNEQCSTKKKMPQVALQRERPAIIQFKRRPQSKLVIF